MRKVMKGRQIWIAIGVVSLVLAGISLFGGAQADDVAVSATTPVRTAPVETGIFRPTIGTSGFVRGVSQADVAPKIGGYVVDLRVEEGDSVRAGQTVAVLDGVELSAARTQAVLSLEAARKTLSETEDYYDQRVDEAEAALEKVEKQYDDGDASEEDRTVAREAEKSAKRLRDAEIAAAEAVVASAEGAAIVAGTMLSQATVTAPFSGTIVARHRSVGSFVAAGTPLYTIVSPDELEIRTAVPAAFSTRVEVGAPVLIRPEHGAEELSGTVFSVARAVGEASRQTVARVRIDADREKELPSVGTYAEVEIPVDGSRDCVSVPERAIIERYDDTFVFVVEDGVAERRRVELGDSSDGCYRVLSGVSAGERVIVEGHGHLRDGDAVSESE